jgi:hypothetical protein
MNEFIILASKQEFHPLLNIIYFVNANAINGVTMYALGDELFV